MKRKTMKLGLLGVVAALILSLPVAASAEPRTQVVVVDQLPVTSSPSHEIITRPRQSIEVVPLTISNYWGTVNLLPEGGETVDNSRMLPVHFNFNVKSIEITGTNSHLVYADTWDVYHPLDWYTNPNSQFSNETGITFYSLGGAATVTAKVTNYNGEWGYFIVNVSPPAVDHLLGTVNLHPAKGVSGAAEMTLPAFLKYDVSNFSPLGPLSSFVNVKLANNGANISFSTSVMAKTTMVWRVVNNKGQWGYYIINVEPIGYCLPPV